MRARRFSAFVTALGLVAAAAGLVGASAASLNGAVAADLGAWNVTQGTGARTVLTWSSFTGVDGTNLNGTALNGPGTWVAGAGTWTIRANAAASSNTVRSNLSVDVGTQNAIAVVTLTIGASARAGLIVNSNGTASLYALYSRGAGGTIQLYKNNGTQTLLGTVTGVGRPASGLLEVDSTTTTIKVSFAGTQVLTYILTAAEAAIHHGATNTRFGLIADRDNRTRFDDFHVDQ